MCLVFNALVALTYHRGYLGVDFVCKVSYFHRTFITFALFSYGNFSILCLFFTYDEKVRNLFQFVVADFLADFLVAVIDHRAHSEFVKLFYSLVGIVVELLAYGKHHGLFGYEPQGKFACRVFKQYGHETFHDPKGAR